MKLTIRSFCALFLLAAVSACAAAPVMMVRWPATNPTNAVLATEGVTIRSTDGSFVMRTGKPVVPPLVHDVAVHQNNQGGAWVGSADGGGYSPENAVDAGFWDLGGIQHAIMEVEIDVDGLAKPLVGRMIFFSVFDDSTESSARRMWRVQIPKSHISDAREGFVQTIYQPYMDETTDWCSWVLSFSSVAF